MRSILIRWFIFSVLLGIVPIAFAALYRRITTGELSLRHTLRRGELLLVTVILSGGSIGYVMGVDADYYEANLTAGGLSLVVLLLAALLHAAVSSNDLQNPDQILQIRNVSIGIFIAGLFTSLSCVAVGGMR